MKVGFVPNSSKASSGNSLVFDYFFRESKDSILRSVIFVTGDQHDAEDCVAEAFEKAYKQWSYVSTLDSPKAWVCKVAANIHTDRQRRHSRFVKLWPKIAVSESEQATTDSLSPELIAAMNCLPQRQREIVAYRLLLELSAKETSALLSISVATVGTHLHRALQTLRTQMKQSKESSSK